MDPQLVPLEKALREVSATSDSALVRSQAALRSLRMAESAWEREAARREIVAARENINQALDRGLDILFQINNAKKEGGTT